MARHTRQINRINIPAQVERDVTAESIQRWMESDIIYSANMSHLHSRTLPCVGLPITAEQFANGRKILVERSVYRYCRANRINAERNTARLAALV